MAPLVPKPPQTTPESSPQNGVAAGVWQKSAKSAIGFAAGIIHGSVRDRCLSFRGTGHDGGMGALLILALVFAGWCLLSIPLAVAIGRAFRAAEISETDAAFEAIVRGYDAA